MTSQNKIALPLFALVLSAVPILVYFLEAVFLSHPYPDWYYEYYVRDLSLASVLFLPLAGILLGIIVCYRTIQPSNTARKIANLAIALPFVWIFVLIVLIVTTPPSTSSGM